MLPQLDYTTYPLQIFWLLVNLPILHFCISVIVIQRLDKVIKQRDTILKENKQTTTQNYQKAKSEKEKYDLAITKAELLAQDIIKDNKILIEENKVAVYEKLKGEIKALNKVKQEEINLLLTSIKPQAMNEVLKIIDTYYSHLVLESINDKNKEKLRKEIEKIL